MHACRSTLEDPTNTLLRGWAVGFAKIHPDAKFEVVAEGGKPAPTALLDRSAHFAATVRAMRKEEIEAFEKKYDYKPTNVATAIDMIVVHVHPSSPLQSLTLPQVQAIFGRSRQGDGERPLVTWGDLGIEGEWADREIHRHGRDAASPPARHFREQALQQGPFGPSVREHRDGAAVLAAVAEDPFAIGYTEIGPTKPGTRPLAISNEPSGPAIEPSPENARRGEYPLARPLLLYLDCEPGTTLDPLRQQFLRYVLSKAAQTEVARSGRVPLTGKLVQAQLAKLGLGPK